MTHDHTTQQFSPIILSLDLTVKDQQSAVEKAVTLNLFQGPHGIVGTTGTNSRHPELNSRHPELNSRHPGLDPGSSNLGDTKISIANTIWLNQIDQPFGIDQWRDLLPQIQSTISNRSLVVAILHADTLSLATQNAMLKSLEEPPSSVQFLLATTRPTALLPTIQSRCHLVKFSSSSSLQQSVNQSATQSTLIEAIDLIKTVQSGSIASALIASDQFNDRDQAKVWIIQVLDWSQKQLSQKDQHKHVAGQQSEDVEEATNLEPAIDLDHPTWISALLTAHQQLEQNLHVKLVMDQLLLTLVNNKTSSC